MREIEAATRAGAVRGQQNEVEAVIDLFDAIFDGNASHPAPQKI
jgi:hypothetical protein